MRIILSLTLTVFLTLPLSAQETLTKTVVCYPAEQLFAAIVKKYDERPTFTARVTDTPNIVTLLVNQQTKTWTFVEFTHETACVINHGTGYVITPEKKVRQ